MDNLSIELKAISIEDEIDTQTYDNPIDAIFEMIQLLHEQKLL